jgi:hypothetical protein
VLIIHSDDPVTHGEIRVSPRSLDFGEVVVGSGPHTRALTIANDGDVALHLSGTIAIDEPFSASEPLTTLLAPGTSTSLEVHFDPDEAGEWSAHIWVESDDLDDPAVDVNLLGRTADVGNDTGM